MSPASGTGLREVLAEFGFEDDMLLRMSLCWWSSKPTAQHGNAEESVWGVDTVTTVK